jgi:hypothetical protein
LENLLGRVKKNITSINYGMESETSARMTTSGTIDPANRAHLDLKSANIQPSVVSGKSPDVRLSNTKTN